MTDKLKKLKHNYDKLSDNTQLIIRIWVISTVWATIMAIITHTADQYTLLLLSDDLTLTARSLGIIGGICTIIAVNWDIKTKQSRN